ncbi:unnamed protein product [Amoebophrya sp. A120]|nr:unnamed protein product [Amoebophrya sp. A120]|eukprot:GSA120T00006047001.1
MWGRLSRRTAGEQHRRESGRGASVPRRNERGGPGSAGKRRRGNDEATGPCGVCLRRGYHRSRPQPEKAQRTLPGGAGRRQVAAANGGGGSGRHALQNPLRSRPPPPYMFHLWGDNRLVETHPGLPRVHEVGTNLRRAGDPRLPPHSMRRPGRASRRRGTRLRDRGRGRGGAGRRTRRDQHYVRHHQQGRRDVQQHHSRRRSGRTAEHPPV